MDYLVNRLSEKSTWTALGVLAGAIGWKVTPQAWDSIMVIGMAVGGFLGTVLPARVSASKVDKTS